MTSIEGMARQAPPGAGRPGRRARGSAGALAAAEAERGEPGPVLCARWRSWKRPQARGAGHRERAQVRRSSASPTTCSASRTAWSWASRAPRRPMPLLVEGTEATLQAAEQGLREGGDHRDRPAGRAFNPELHEAMVDAAVRRVRAEHGRCRSSRRAISSTAGCCARRE